MAHLVHKKAGGTKGVSIEYFLFDADSLNLK
jgi:hypothetical protein